MNGPLRSAVAGLPAFGLLACLSLSPAPTADGAELPSVDVALVLAVDVSASIDDRERQIQREGYAEAIADPSVIEAIAEGAHGRILVTVFEWSDELNDEVRVPWMVISGAEDARKVADMIRKPGSAIPHSTTSISGALWKARAMLDDVPYRAEREVIDISGDGKDYQLGRLSTARDAVLERGATINGLPILAAPDDPDVERFYREHVIGGPASFLSPAKDFHDIAPALRRKLVLELT